MPTIDPVWIWIALGAVALLVVVALIARGSRRARSAALRDKFGREYDHTIEEAGSRKRAERELVARTEEVKKYDIRPLNAGEREKYRRDWLRVEQRFVERPRMAVAEADELVAEIMRVQGYPIGDFDKHAAHLSVTHPRVVEHYRHGHKIVGTGGTASTEDLRQAMLHYRALFEELIGDRSGGDVARDLPRENEVLTPSRTAREATDRDEKRV
ncbi:MAG TPA: hypothetical protein VHL59_05865 [Thermoanaerobaculia bacterium]|nr:hypothetical protein [Thermoanaerobaculia bacterium]